LIHSWAAPPHLPCTKDDIASLPWLLQRLARNNVVLVTPATELPQAADRDRAHAERTGITARLAVPVAVGPWVVYGLILGSRRYQTEWRAPFIDRFRLAGEILGAGLERFRTHQSRGMRDAKFPEALGGKSDSISQAPRVDADDAQIIGESQSLRRALGRLSQVAPLDATVLLLGETGTGKELFARALHNGSRRRREPFIRVNCAALPATLIESELFGHERGAFTGAITTRQGRFEVADGGTIFLDEIGDLAPELQVKLLRVLQEGEFERIGSSSTRRSNVRVIAATHVDLEKAIAAGRFRPDLYYRLSVFPIKLPPLRDRPEDIPRLVSFFIDRHQSALERRITDVPADLMAALKSHDWPGNVRELENVIERALIRSVDGTLRLDEPLHSGNRAVLPRSGDSLDAVQRFHIEKVLSECGGRINGPGNAAFRLGMHPNTLRFRIKKLGVIRRERPAILTPPISAGS
jgi:transcriptional regulator with GAF, ATPase, and Fis domain